MSLSHSPKIITDGLVLYLDASNLKSYPGSGNTWNDLSGNENTGTLTNGPVYNSSNPRYISFDGTDDYVIANNTSLNSKFSSTSVSHSTWIYPVSAGQIVSELGQSSINTAWHTSNIEISSAGAFSFSTWHSGLGNKVVSSNQSLNQRYHLVFSYNGTTLTAYINGESIGTATFTRQAAYNNGYQTHYALCAIDSTNMGTSGYAGARISSFSVYNRSLTSIEVKQNFNAVRGRYGI